MWVNLQDQYVFPERLAVAPLCREDFVNAGLDADAMYKFAKLPEFNEDFVRMLLRGVYEPHYNVANWQLHVVQYNLAFDCVDVLVSSLEFEPRPAGMECKRLNAFDAVLTGQ